MSYHHFSATERGKLEAMLEQGMTQQAMARELGRHRTSVGRELRRNGTKTGYDADTAHGRYCKRRHRCRPVGKLAKDTPLRDYVMNKIGLEQWTPELVAGRLPLDHPDDPSMRVCHESVYQAIYTDGHHLDTLRHDLPQARPKRRKRAQGKRRRGPSIPNRVGIKQRPQSVEERCEVGHWEGDLIVGKGHDGFALTLVERRSRLLEAKKSKTKAAEEVSAAVIDALQERPTSWVKSITFDNGTEFADHATMTHHLGVSVYFADPYSAYQRGSNEQVNGLIRRYLPKRAHFANLTQDDLDRIVEKINNRPRKCLGYRTPNEVFQKQRQEHLRALRT